MKKLFLGTLLLAIITLNSPNNVSAAVNDSEDVSIENLNTGLIVQKNDDGSITETLSEEEQNNNIQQQIQAQINAEIQKNSMLRSPTWVNYSYKTVETKYPVVKGYAGGQPVGGSKFSTGGGFSWNSSGGPNVSVGVGWGGVSVAANLGKASKSTVGYSVAAPNKTNYFKLHVAKKYKVQKVAVYACPYGQPNKPQFQYYSYPKTFYSQDLSAKKI